MVAEIGCKKSMVFSIILIIPRISRKENRATSLPNLFQYKLFFKNSRHKVLIKLEDEDVQKTANASERTLISRRQRR